MGSCSGCLLDGNGDSGEKRRTADVDTVLPDDGLKVGRKLTGLKKRWGGCKKVPKDPFHVRRGNFPPRNSFTAHKIPVSGWCGYPCPTVKEAEAQRFTLLAPGHCYGRGLGSEPGFAGCEKPKY